MYYYVLEPFEKNGKAVLAIHGHGSNGKEVLAGIITEETKKNYEKFNYTYATEFAKMGYTVYIPDLCGSGERAEVRRKGSDSDCNEINNSASAIGISLQGIIVTELMRLTDIMENDGFRNLLVCGFSGGGLFSLILAALDGRIKYTISSGYFHSYKSTVMTNNFCGCNFVPELWKRFDICDYAALIAPKKLGVETGREDSLNIDGKQVAIYIESIYNIYGENNNFVYNECDGVHKWFGSLYNTIKEWEGL